MEGTVNKKPELLTNGGDLNKLSNVINPQSSLRTKNHLKTICRVYFNHHWPSSESEETERTIK